MGPKKGGKGKGKGKKVKADPGWAKTVQWGKWERPFESLPDAIQFPNFAPIREAFLQAVKECPSLEWLSLARSKSLKRAVIETRNLRELIIDTCPVLEKLLVWSGELTSLKGLSDSKELQYLFLDCPLLTDFEHPKLFVPEKPKVYHPTLLQLRKWADKQRPLPDKEFGLLAKDLTHEHDDGLHEELNYPNVPRFPRTLMQGF